MQLLHLSAANDCMFLSCVVHKLSSERSLAFIWPVLYLFMVAGGRVAQGMGLVLTLTLKHCLEV